MNDKTKEIVDKLIQYESENKTYQEIANIHNTTRQYIQYLFLKYLKRYKIDRTYIYTRKQICKDCGIVVREDPRVSNNSEPKKILCRKCFKKRASKRFKKYDYNEILRMRNSGMKVNDIAKKLNCNNFRTIFSILHRIKNNLIFKE